jgi:hypothetical protein
VSVNSSAAHEKYSQPNSSSAGARWLPLPPATPRLGRGRIVVGDVPNVDADEGRDDALAQRGHDLPEKAEDLHWECHCGAQATVCSKPYTMVAEFTYGKHDQVAYVVVTLEPLTVS